MAATAGDEPSRSLKFRNQGEGLNVKELVGTFNPTCVGNAALSCEVGEGVYFKANIRWGGV